MILESKFGSTNSAQKNGEEDSALWHKLSEDTQARLCGGNSQRIRIKLKAYDHAVWAMILMF
jgi:hypothetical protein